MSRRGPVNPSSPAAPPDPSRGFVVAGRPVGPTSGLGIQHLFTRPGEWSLCHEAVWTGCVRCDPVNALTWICLRCKAFADGRPDPCPAPLTTEERVAAVEGGTCPVCRGSLTDPGRSPEGWRHCRACRVGWRSAADRIERRDWPGAA
jgi:hypothetical protein